MSTRTLITLPFETLENILIDCSDHQLLQMQHVCKHIKSAIENSKKVQRKLYLLDKKSDKPTASLTEDDIEINPLIDRMACIQISFPPSIYDNEPYTTAPYYTSYSVRSRPTDGAPELDVRLISHRLTTIVRERANLPVLPSGAWPLLLSGSQSQMQLTQPAIPIKLKISTPRATPVDCQGKHRAVYQTFQLPAGSTMSVLLQCLRQADEDVMWEERLEWEEQLRR